MTPLRVLIVCAEFPPHLVGGLGTHTGELAAGLARAGAEVAVFVFRRGVDDLIERDGVTARFLTPRPAGGAQTPAQALAAFNDQLADAALLHYERRRARPDVIHVHDWMGIQAGTRLRGRLAAPLVATVHFLNHPLADYWGDPVSDTIRDMEARMCRDTDTVITVSDAMRGLILDRHPREPARVIRIWNGCDPIPPPASAGAPAAWQAALPPAGPMIGFAGRLAAMKGIEALLRSAVPVLRAIPEAFYGIAGWADPSYQETLDAIRRAAPDVAGRILFCGRIDRRELPRFYARASLALVPSIWEPFGYAALEAMQFGVPVIATHAGGLPELVEDGVSGLLVPVRQAGAGSRREVDEAALAAAQLRVLRAPDLARRLAAGGRLRARQRSRAAMTQATLRAYAQVQRQSSLP